MIPRLPTREAGLLEKPGGAAILLLLGFVAAVVGSGLAGGALFTIGSERAARRGQ